MTLKSTKYLSPFTSLTLYFLYICFLLSWLCCLNGCTKTKADLSSQEKAREEVVLPDSDPKVVANTPSHMLANRIGNELYRKIERSESKSEKEPGFTPLSSSDNLESETELDSKKRPEFGKIVRKFTPLNVDGEKLAKKHTPRFGELTNYRETEDTRLVTLQAQRAKNVQVTCTVKVVKLMEDDLIGKKHQRFLVELSNNTTVLVAHNLNLAPKVPLFRGAIVEICGEYIWNEKGGVLHYTHHTTNRRHLSGYISLNGKKYK